MYCYTKDLTVRAHNILRNADGNHTSGNLTQEDVLELARSNDESLAEFLLRQSGCGMRTAREIMDWCANPQP